MTGAVLTKRVRNYLKKKYNAYTINVVTASTTGVPDIVGCVKGLFFAFELKGTNDIPSVLQYKIIDIIKQKGGIAAIIDAEDYKKTIDNIFINVS